MNPLLPNPDTGFLESNNPATLEAFTSDKKIEFLAMGLKYALQRQLPDVGQMCDALKIDYDTFNDHLHKDQKFRHEWESIKKRTYFGLANELSVKANTKGGIIANLAALKYLERGKFSEDLINLNPDYRDVKDVLMRENEVIEASIVDKHEV